MPVELKTVFSAGRIKKTKILRVSLNYMDPDLAKRIDFYGYVSKYPPNYLFLENFCFNINHVDSTGRIAPPIDAALLQIRNYIRNALGVGTQDNYYIKWYTFDVKPPEMNFTPMNLIVSCSRGFKKINV